MGWKEIGEHLKETEVIIRGHAAPPPAFAKGRAIFGHGCDIPLEVKEIFFLQLFIQLAKAILFEILVGLFLVNPRQPPSAVLTVPNIHAN
jgi:hypothetical protein